jgi:hypothetical protein
VIWVMASIAIELTFGWVSLLRVYARRYASQNNY